MVSPNGISKIKYVNRYPMYLPSFPSYYWAYKKEREGDLFDSSLITYFVELLAGKTKIQTKINIEDFNAMTFE